MTHVVTAVSFFIAGMITGGMLRRHPRHPSDATIDKIKVLISKLESAHVDRLYVSKDYTLGDLQRELKNIIGVV